jgi:hypothetical protein
MGNKNKGIIWVIKSHNDSAFHSAEIYAGEDLMCKLIGEDVSAFHNFSYGAEAPLI